MISLTVEDNIHARQEKSGDIKYRKVAPCALEQDKQIDNFYMTSAISREEMKRRLMNQNSQDLMEELEKAVDQLLNKAAKSGQSGLDIALHERTLKDPW